MLEKYASVLSVAATLAAAVAAAVAAGVEPEEAYAATSITVRTCGGGTIELNSDEKRILDLQNQARTSRGKEALCVHPALTRAARAHSQDMLDRDYSSHTSPDGETVKQRLERFGYTFDGYSSYAYGENIAWGAGTTYATPDNLFRWWMRSKKHRKNILKDGFREVGIGVETGTYRTHTNTMMGTVDFGVRS